MHLLIRLLAIMGVLAGCNASQAQNTAVPIVPTSVQLSWFHTIEFAGFYEAERQNYYKEAGLEVRLDAGGFDAGGAYIDPVAQVVSGKQPVVREPGQDYVGRSRIDAGVDEHHDLATQQILREGTRPQSALDPENARSQVLGFGFWLFGCAHSANPRPDPSFRCNAAPIGMGHSPSPCENRTPRTENRHHSAQST
jgi:hypothetical protein